MPLIKRIKNVHSAIGFIRMVTCLMSTFGKEIAISIKNKNLHGVIGLIRMSMHLVWAMGKTVMFSYLMSRRLHRLQKKVNQLQAFNPEAYSALRLHLSGSPVVPINFSKDQ